MSASRLVMVIVAASFMACLADVAVAAQQASSPAQDASIRGLPSPDLVPETCPVTKRPASTFVPPWPYPATPGGVDRFWFGTDRLWTTLSDGANWRGLPHDSSKYRQKLFWYRAGYDWRLEPPEKLFVTGKRLDAPAPLLIADDHANAGWTRRDQPFIVIGIDLPTLGCWEITARYEDDELSFVVWVQN